MNAKQIAMKKYRRIVATKRPLDLTLSDVYDDGYNAGVATAIASMVEYTSLMNAATGGDEMEAIYDDFKDSIGAEVMRQVARLTFSPE